MYLAIPTQKSCAAAWLMAALGVNAAPKHAAQNVLIDVAEPLLYSDADREIVRLLDRFLREHNAVPLQTVANTIFPEALYRRHGAPKFYKVYRDSVYPKITKKAGDWGRYFHRIIHYRSPDGTIINPLADLIEKLYHHVHGGGKRFKNVYELSVFDPVLDMRVYDAVRDSGRVMNRQCLSFMSFKLDDKDGLSLTAMYRNHYYVERLLGNMIGLSRLMAFVAEEAKVKPTFLTILSTHAHVEQTGWSREDLAELLRQCQKAISLSNDG